MAAVMTGSGADVNFMHASLFLNYKFLGLILYIIDSEMPSFLFIFVLFGSAAYQALIVTFCMLNLAS